MKYIRTKDTLASVEREEDIELFKRVGQKVADTIKELCDEFVVIGYKIKDPFIFSKEGISIDDFWKHSPSDTIVYGAIWTEWGLKYVAKMNESGVLELLWNNISLL